MPIEYKIKSGDTLSALAKRFGVPQDILQSVNGLASPHKIRAGANLTIPQPGDENSMAEPEPEVPVEQPKPPEPPAPPPEDHASLMYKSDYDKMIASGQAPMFAVTTPDPPPPAPPSVGPTFKEEGTVPDNSDPTRLPGMLGRLHDIIDPVKAIAGKSGSPEKSGLNDYLMTALMGLGAGAKPVPAMPKIGDLPQKSSAGVELPHPAAFDKEAVSPANPMFDRASGRIEPTFGPQPGFKPGPMPEFKPTQPPMPQQQPGPLQGLPSRAATPYSLAEPSSMNISPLHGRISVEGRMEPSFPRTRKPMSDAQKEINAMWRRHESAIKKKGKSTIDMDNVNKVLEMMRMKGGFNG